jgi:anaerobic magnesium-protoporphyrin IX monomethyl ester cyclase
MKGYGSLFLRRIPGRPLQTAKLLRRFGRYMKSSDLIKLLASPFRRRTLTRKPELLARMIDSGIEEPVRNAAVTLLQ